MSDVDSRNEAARRRAQEAGRAFYVSEIVYLEPTCVECAQRIAGSHKRQRLWHRVIPVPPWRLVPTDEGSKP